MNAKSEPAGARLPRARTTEATGEVGRSQRAFRSLNNQLPPNGVSIPASQMRPDCVLLEPACDQPPATPTPPPTERMLPRAVITPLVEQIAFKRSGTTRMTTTKSFDKMNRLTRIRSVDAQSAPVATFDYNYNPASQRTSVTNADGSFWSYSYDALGQVTSGKKYWSDGAPVLGQQFDYTFDDIGNRKTSVTGGDQWGANKRYQNYTANLLNQYSQRTVPGYADLMGTANSNATVTVQSSTGVTPASRKREYFRAEVAAQNNSAPVWLGFTNIATLTNGANTDIVTNTTGRLLVVQTPEVFAHDLDGNLLRDGQWTNSWDAENRLIAQETLPAVYGAGAPRQRLEYDYDPQGRRLVKRAYEWVSGNWSLKYAVRFVWDGWNLLAELNPTNHLGIRSYAWGSDLSGSAQGAGGVGGLLWVTEHGTAQPSVHFAAFDGNGNVAALVDAVEGTVSANYEYGPFGETIRCTGSLAKANPLRFSTKYEETETGCMYYGYRSYNSSTGRWLSRDPIGENGGVNTVSYVGNGPIDRVERLGLDYIPYPFPHNTSPPSKPKCGTCGPEIGTALLETMERVEKQFKALTAADQARSCNPLNLVMQWDIYPPSSMPKGCGDGDCVNCFAIGGKCHQSAVINYALFGTICRLCKYSKVSMHTMIAGNKIVLKPLGQIFGPDPWDWQNNPDVYAFADLAYDRNLDAKIPTSSKGYGNCSKCRNGRPVVRPFSTNWPYDPVPAPPIHLPYVPVQPMPFPIISRINEDSSFVPIW